MMKDKLEKTWARRRHVPMVSKWEKVEDLGKFWDIYFGKTGKRNGNHLEERLDSWMFNVPG